MKEDAMKLIFYIMSSGYKLAMSSYLYRIIIIFSVLNNRKN